MKIEHLFLASRPKTWSAALAPVLMASSLAFKEEKFSLPLFTFTLLFALLIQIATNFANDYFDFLKGADTQERKGPKRALLEGWISLEEMKKQIILFFSLSFIVAIPLMISSGLLSLLIVVASILSGIFYTAGSKPLGYSALGELFVFVFFGPVAFLGTYFLQTKTLSFFPLLASLVPGLLSSAILIANNLRDRRTDEKANKRTLIVEIGEKKGILLFLATFFISFILSFFLGKNLAWSFLFAIVPLQALLAKDFQSLLPKTSFFLLIYAFFFILQS